MPTKPTTVRLTVEQPELVGRFDCQTMVLRFQMNESVRDSTAGSKAFGPNHEIRIGTMTVANPRLSHRDRLQTLPHGVPLGVTPDDAPLPKKKVRFAAFASPN